MCNMDRYLLVDDQNLKDTAPPFLSSTKSTNLYILIFCTVLFPFLTIFYKKMLLSKA